MDIQMVGIDHSKATIAQREAFSFTKNQAVKIMEQWREENRFSGCLLLSTCNRTELWVSGKQVEESLSELLCRARGVQSEGKESLFLFRKGHQAAEHLLQLVCGMKSKIYGEDQIISQVREALELSRKAKCNDLLIEKLFQTAVAAGKRVKTEVKAAGASPSAARNCLSLLQEKLGSVKGVDCLVIGNGQMGKLTAVTLAEAGANVHMTLRKKFHGCEMQESLHADGCIMIEYEDRLENIEAYKAVISATASPHYTVRKEDLKGKKFRECIWVDMAVPRDLDPAIEEVPGIELYDMDKLGDRSNEENADQMMKASEAILQEYEEELEQWFRFRKYTDRVKDIAALAGEDAGKRVGKSLQAPAEDAARKAAEKILFGLRDTLPKEYWEVCFDALEKSAQRDTVKTGKGKKGE